MERSSDSVFELFLDEDSETTPDANAQPNSYKTSLDEYKEETEPAFLFKGAYGSVTSEYSEQATSNNQSIEEYANNQEEYGTSYSYTSHDEKDTPVKTQSGRPKIADRIKTFEQLSNSNSSSPQINRYINDNYERLEQNNQVDLPEIPRQDSSSSVYLNDEELSQDSYSDLYPEEAQSDRAPPRSVSAPLIHANSRDWNVEFQTLISLPTQSTLERLDRAKQIQIFVREFTSEVSRIGKVIINEVGKSAMNKTYPPVNVGGIAGGEKYLVNNIFFKFALDIYHLYGGTEFAMKAANMELLGLDAYLDAQKVVHGLRIPLMCLLDYKGYRLAATTVLPIDKDTLIYGSADGGKTVMMSNPLVNKAMEDAAKYLNIKPHRVTDNLVTIHSPIDIEVHAAHDNNYYVLDTARVWPPEHPVSFLPAMLLPAKGDNIEKFDLDISKLSDMLGQSLEKASSVLSEGVVYFGDQKELENEPMNEFASIIAGFPIKGKAVFIYGFQGRFLYNQLRPEFVKKYSKPLSSDAFSGFGKHDAKVNNAEIIEATKHLRDIVVRNLADKLLKGQVVVSSGSGLVDAMHQHGVNVRYLGLLLNYCSDDSRLSGMIMTEMVARTLKNFMKRKLRMMKTREDGHCQKIIVKYLNIALGNSPHSELFWNKLIYLLMEMKFGQYLTSKINQKLKNPLRVYISNVPLLFGLLKHIGVKLGEEIHKQIIYDKSFLNTRDPFKFEDILSIDSSLKVLKFGSPKEFNSLIDDHVTFLLKDMPQHNNIEYIVQSKKEKQKIVKNFYGNNHVQCALSVTELASFYVNENRLEEAKAHLVLANELLYIIREVPVEAYLSLMLSFGLVEEKLGNTQKALDYYLIGLGLIDRLFSPAAKSAVGMMFHALMVNQTHHPMLLFFLNNCIKYLKDDSKTIIDLKELAAAYFNTWKTLEFPGDSDARSRLFGADYPYAMSLVWEEHLSATTVNINQQMASKLLHVELGDKPLSDQVTQQWLSNVLLNDNQSGVTIYVNMEADDLLKLKYPVPRLFVPNQVALGTTLKFSWEGIDASKHPYKIRLLSSGDNAYLHDVSRVVEVESYVVSSFSGEMSIPPTKLAKPGQYYLDVADGSFTSNARLFGFLVTAPDTPPIDNFSIELSSRKLAVEYDLLGRDINGAAMSGRGGFLLTDGEEPVFIKTSDEGVGAVLKGKDFVSIKSTHFELLRTGYTFVEKVCFIGLTKNRQLYTWGYGKNYANGHGSEDTLTVPRAVASLTGVKVFDACGGSNFMAVLTIKGEVLLSGTIPWSNQALKTFIPFELPKKERVVSICSSAYGLCLLTEKGYALYYGDTYEDLKNPKIVTGIKLTFKNEKIIDIAAGSNHHMFISESGKIAGLGLNNTGSLGYGHTEVVKYLTEDMELKPANQCPGIKFVRVFANRTVSAAIDDQGRFYYWGSGLLLPRSPVALSQYNIKSAHFFITHIIVSTNPSAPYKLQLEPLEEFQMALPATNNNNNQDLKRILNQARDQLLAEYFGSGVKEFLTKCGLTVEQVTNAERAFANFGLTLNDLPLLNKSGLSRIINDELVVLKIVQHVTGYYLKLLSNVNN